MSRTSHPEERVGTDPADAPRDLEAGPLQVLGLDHRGALVYMHLCVHGTSKAGSIVDATRLGRGDVYRALDELVARGDVVAGPERPAAFTAVDPERVFARALAQNETRSAAIADAAPVLAAWWARTAASRPTEGEAFRHLEGQAAIAALAERMARSATRAVLILDRWPRGAALPAPRAGALRSVVPAHVELRVVDDAAGQGDAPPAPASDAASSWFLVVDGEQALFLDAAAQTGHARSALRATWTDSPGVVAMAVALHASLSAKRGRASR